MNKIYFLVILFVGINFTSFAQKIVDSRLDTMNAAEYTEFLTKFYTKELNLDPQQQQQTYTAILGKRTRFDSLTINGANVDADKLWALYTSLDEKFRVILNNTQFEEYDELQSKSYWWITSKKR